jgi:hypothetical protein
MEGDKAAIGEKRKRNVLFWLELVNLLNVNSKTTSCVKTARTHATFEVFGLLVLH